MTTSTDAPSISQGSSNFKKKKDWKQTTAAAATAASTSVWEVVTGILGYDLMETRTIEANRTFHDQIVSRLGNASAGVPAETLVGDLDQE